MTASPATHQRLAWWCTNCNGPAGFEHDCPPLWDVWEPDELETRADATRVRACDASTAAARYLENLHRDDPEIVEVKVLVAKVGGVDVSALRAVGEVEFVVGEVEALATDDLDAPIPFELSDFDRPEGTR